MTKKQLDNNLALELHVPQFAPARDFYGKLGFQELSYEPASDIPEQLGYLVLRRTDELGYTMLNFYGDRPSVAEHPHFRRFSARTPRGYAVEITIPVADIDKLWAEVSPWLNPAAIVEPLETKPWGDKDFRLIDPYGFYVRFTEMVDWGQ